MAEYKGHLTKQVIDRVLAEYLGDPLRGLGFHRQGGGGTWRRESIPGRRETIKTTASKHGPVEGLGNRFGVEFQFEPWIREVRPFGHLLMHLTPEQEAQFLSLDRRIAARLDRPEGYEDLWLPYSDRGSEAWWDFRCLDEEDVHAWGGFLQPVITSSYRSWWAQKLPHLAG